MPLFTEIRHDLARVRTIARVMARHGFAPSMRRIPLLRAEVAPGDAASTDPPGKRFATMLEELGPTFVKVGQLLSTRQDLLPLSFTRELSRLQDQVPPFPFADAKRVVEEELARPLADAFVWFDETPLASASMAQVHAAKIDVEGRHVDVVVKILRPGIEERVRADASLLVLTAQLLETLVEEAAHYRARSLAEEFESALRRELDFAHEADNLVTFAKNNEGREGIHVPRLYPAWCRKRVLVMERIFGKRISVLEDDADRSRAHAIVERLVKVGYEHFFVDGVFHGDPHPGNLLITDDDQVAFIDFGIVGRVSRATQDRLLLVLLALALRDADALARLLVRVGDVEGRVVLLELKTAIAKLLDRWLGLPVGEVSPALALADLLDLSTRFGIRIPRELAILSKASIAIDGVVRALHPGYDPSVHFAKRTEELVVERFDPRSLQGGGMRGALQLGLVVDEVPLQLTQALYDLERGNLTVRFVSDTADRIERDLRGLGMTVFGGLLASSLTLGAIYVLARYDWSLFGVPLLPVVALMLASGMFGVAFAWFLTGGRVPKMRLRTLLRDWLMKEGPPPEGPS